MKSIRSKGPSEGHCKLKVNLRDALPGGTQVRIQNHLTPWRALTSVDRGKGLWPYVTSHPGLCLLLFTIRVTDNTVRVLLCGTDHSNPHPLPSAHHMTPSNRFSSFPTLPASAPRLLSPFDLQRVERTIGPQLQEPRSLLTSSYLPQPLTNILKCHDFISQLYCYCYSLVYITHSYYEYYII